MPPTKYAPDEIRNGMFLPLMIKSFHGGHRYTKIFYPPLLICYAPGEDFFMEDRKFFTPDEIISATPKKEIPLLKKTWTRLCVLLMRPYITKIEINFIEVLRKHIGFLYFI